MTVLAIAASVLGTSQRAFADPTSYTQYYIGESGQHNIVGEYADGDTLVSTPGSTGYTLFDHGAATAVTSASMSFDDGTKCSVSYGGNSYSGLCNGGYDAFIKPSTIGGALYAGLAGQLGLLDNSPNGGIGGVFLNASGDLAYDDIGQENLEQAYPAAATTPEPATWVLMLTGAGLMFTMHRRLVA